MPPAESWALGRKKKICAIRYAKITPVTTRSASNAQLLAFMARSSLATKCLWTSSPRRVGSFPRAPKISPLGCPHRRDRTARNFSRSVAAAARELSRPERSQLELARARGAVQLVQGFGADLSYALARQLQGAADLFQGALVFPVQTEAQV